MGIIGAEPTPSFASRRNERNQTDSGRHVPHLSPDTTLTCSDRVNLTFSPLPSVGQVRDAVERGIHPLFSGHPFRPADPLRLAVENGVDRGGSWTDKDLGRSVSRHGRLVFISVSSNPDTALQNLFRSRAFVLPQVKEGHTWLVVDASRSTFPGLAAAYECVRESLSDKLAGTESQKPVSRVPTGSRVLVYVHDDVLLLPGFEESLYDQLDRLAETDPHWCLLSVVGVRNGPPGNTPAGPSDGGHKLRGQLMTWKGQILGDTPYDPLPTRDVLIVDEALMVVRQRSPANFRADMPGLHCYGATASLSCALANQTVYTLRNVTVAHKLVRAEGSLTSDKDVQAWIDRLWHPDLRVPLFAAAKWIRRHFPAHLFPLNTPACPLHVG